MDAHVNPLLSTAVRFVSNADDFGIFLQGFIAGAVAMGGKECKDEIRKAMREAVEVQDAFAATGALYEAFLDSKRATEIGAVRQPQYLTVLREDAIRVVTEILTKMRKEKEKEKED